MRSVSRRREGFLRAIGAVVLFLAAGRGEAQRAVDERVFRGLDGPRIAGTHLVMEPLTLDDGTEVTLDVSPIEVFAPLAEIVVHGQGAEWRIAPPTDRWFVGRVVGDPSSIAMLARGESVRGFIVTGDRVATLSPERGSYRDGPPGRTFVRTFSPETDVPDTMRRFTCDSETLPVPPEAIARTSPRTALSSVIYYAGIAVETDYELYTKFNSPTNLTTYVGDLFAAVSAIYQRDVLVTLQVNYLSIWTTPSDPWTATSSQQALFEFGDYWHTNRSSVPRSTAHFLSGKNLGGGIAWLGVLCRTDLLCSGGNCGSSAADGHYAGGYGVVGSLSGVAPANLTTTYWDFMAVTHEMGHNFGSPHTHCYSPPVDTCYSGESGCYSGGTSVPPEKGTVMSYCHRLTGGYSNIKMFLGVAGETSAAVTTRIRNYVESSASCFGTVAGPVVTGVSPATGPTAGGTPVAISGSGFAAGATVKIGGADATSITVVNASTITATTPSHVVGVADVIVTNPGSQAYTLAGGYIYFAAALVSAISPVSGPTAGGTPVTIAGSGFQTGATVSIGGVAATGISVISASTITATTGAHATGTVSVVVTNPDTTSATLTSAFFYAPVPSSTRFYTLSPCRVVDTRGGAPIGGPVLAVGEQRILALASQCGIPPNALAVSVNLTVVPAAAGYVTLYPGNGVNPGTSSINFGAGQTRANSATLQLATDGTGTAAAFNGSSGSNHLIVDVNGYFR